MSVLKPFNRRKTKQTVAPIRAHTTWSPNEVRGVIERLVDADRDETQHKHAAKAVAKPRSFAARAMKMHLHLARTADGYLLSYPYDYKSRNDWVAELTIAADRSGSMVTSHVVRWLEKDGELSAAVVYLKFVDALGIALGSGDLR